MTQRTDTDLIDKAVELRLAYDKLVRDRGDYEDAVDRVGAAAGAWLDAENLLNATEYNVYQLRYSRKKKQA